MQALAWCGEWCAKSGLQSVCIGRLLRVSNLCEHRTKAVYYLKLMVGGSEHKVVLDESGFRAYCIDVDWGLNFLSVAKIFEEVKQRALYIRRSIVRNGEVRDVVSESSQGRIE